MTRFTDPLPASALQARRAYERHYCRKIPAGMTYQAATDVLVQEMGAETAAAYILSQSNDPAFVEDWVAHECGPLCPEHGDPRDTSIATPTQASGAGALYECQQPEAHADYHAQGFDCPCHPMIGAVR